MEEAVTSSPGWEPTRFTRYFPYLGSVFLLALVFSASSFLFFFAWAGIFGADATNSFFSQNPSYPGWVQRVLASVFFSVFFLVGRKVDFGRQYAPIAAMALAGVIVGGLPEFAAIQVASRSHPTQIVLLVDPVTAVRLASTLFETFSIAVAGLAVSFLVKARFSVPSTPPPVVGEPLSGATETLQPKLASIRVVLPVGFAIVACSYVAEAAADVIGSRYFSGTDQFAFLRTLFVVTPYSYFAIAFFFPLLFFIAFYFLGRRLDIGLRGLRVFTLSVFAGGVLGFLVGYPVDYYIRGLAARGSFPALSLGPSFILQSGIEGFYVLAVGLAAASLGFVRMADKPYNRDKLLAFCLVAAIVVLSAIEVLNASIGSSGTSIVFTTASSTTTTTIAPNA